MSHVDHRRQAALRGQLVEPVVLPEGVDGADVLDL